MANEQQFDEADIRLITGDQGAGKTTITTALPIDDIYANLTAIVNPKTGEYFRARALNEKEINLLLKRGISYHPFNHIKVFSGHGDESKIIAKPNNFIVDSPIRVFSNYHFYGIRFMYADLEKIITYINTPLMMNGWIVLDESIMTDKRDTMTSVGKMMSWFGAQSRRRRIRMLIASQYANMTQGRFVQFAKTKVWCSYDSETHYVTLDVNKKSPVMNSTSFYAPDYWKFFKHDELVLIPQAKVDKALGTITGS